jgi:D-alanine-D-alanine ligase
MNLEAHLVRKIQKSCAELYEKLHFTVYARIDGFITEKGDVFLNDPNTTSGMLPSSFFFHQAAEVGMNPSQFLTYIIRTSIAERLKTGKQTHKLRKMLQEVDLKVNNLQSNQSQKMKVGVIMGGYSSERHISVESGRNIYEKLSSSNAYEPVPIFLTGSSEEHQLYIMPISIMLKDNADDIKEKIEHSFHEPKHEILEETRQKAKSITRKYAGEVDFMPQQISYKGLKSMVSEVFIALHGRPGEDGDVQGKLDELGVPYNGSGVESSRTTIDKFLTKEILKQHGFVLANHRLVLKGQWQLDGEYLFSTIERNFPYPLIAKPHDDGCSSAVKKINNRNELEAYCRMTFRTSNEKNPADLEIFQMDEREEFPKREMFLLEELISAKGASHFLEVTGGLLTKMENGKKMYEMFEPSEALASKGILSLEEKFLAGEGQNITPARFDKNPEKRLAISLKVQEDLRKAAEILNVEGYARIDAFVRIYPDKVETIIIEVNSLPGMTPATCIFHQAAINHYKPHQFIEKILEYGVKKKELN